MSEALNITKAAFGGLRETTTAPLWQWDYGQILQITGLDLPQAFEVHFSNSRKSGETVTQIGTDSQVVIPDMYLTSGADIYCFIFLHDGTDDGETEYVIKIPVRERPEPSDIEPTPEQQDVITQAIAVINTAVTQTGEDKEATAALAEAAAASSLVATEAAQSAQGSATAASASATTATNAANTATAKASEAATSATNAANAKASAEAAQSNAQAAQTASESAQASAQSAAQTATAKASEAAASAASVGEAAQIATAKAAEASASATSASGSATAAAGLASTASTKASEASASATAANDAKEAAETAQTAAQGAAESVSASAAQIAQNTSDISDVKKNLVNNFNLIYNHADGITVNYDLMSGNDLITGLYSSINGTYNPSRTDYCCSKNKMLCEPNGVLNIFKTKGSSLKSLYVGFYTKTGQFISSQLVNNVAAINPIESTVIVPASAYLFDISAMHVYNETLTPSDYGFSIYNGIRYDTTDKRLLSTYDSVGYVVPLIVSWIRGEYISTSDGSVQTHANYHRTDYIEIDPALGSIVFTNVDPENVYDVKYNAWYDANKVFISSFTTKKNGSVSIMPPVNAKYMRLSFNIRTINTISTNYPSVYSRIKWDGLQDYLRGKFVTHMTHNGIGRYIVDARRNAIIKPLMFEFDLSVSVESGYKYAYQYYDGYELGQDHLLIASGWITQKTVIPAGTYFCLIVANSDDSTTSSTIQNNLGFIGIPNFNDVYEKLMPLVEVVKEEVNAYYIDQSFHKQNVKTESVGQVKYLQSFCKYNGHWFSTNGSNICEQDEDFTEIQDVALTVGHGNAFQLGLSNIAYVSGWNDQKVYAVDLDTLTLDSTITLPTTGYTTCAVDEVRKLIYIFQRDSYPSTEDYYNFIVYDYDNEQIVSTRKCTIPFAAMQGCDLCDDRIVVLYGLGTSAAPTGYTLYDLMGNVIGEWKIPNYSQYEPEGVFIDRSTKEIFMGLNGANVYKVT